MAAAAAAASPRADLSATQPEPARRAAAVALSSQLLYNPSKALSGNTATDNAVNGVYATNPIWPDGSTLFGDQRWAYVVNRHGFDAARHRTTIGTEAVVAAAR